MTNIGDSSYTMGPLEPNCIIDEVSSTLFYIGTSINGKTASASTWKIKKIWKDGTIWNIGYPDGDQSFIYNWSDRTRLTYS